MDTGTNDSTIKLTRLDTLITYLEPLVLLIEFPLRGSVGGTKTLDLIATRHLFSEDRADTLEKW